MGNCFLHEVEIKVVFILKIFCFLFAGSGQLTLKGFASFAQWRGSFRLVIGLTSRAISVFS